MTFFFLDWLAVFFLHGIPVFGINCLEITCFHGIRQFFSFATYFPGIVNNFSQIPMAIHDVCKAQIFSSLFSAFEPFALKRSKPCPFDFYLTVSVDFDYTEYERQIDPDVLLSVYVISMRTPAQ